jgi:hypothetical protein
MGVCDKKVLICQMQYIAMQLFVVNFGFSYVSIDNIDNFETEN